MGGPVTVVVPRCTGGRFVTVMRLRVAPDREGNFVGSFPVKAPSDCYIEAIRADESSDRKYLSFAGPRTL
jgi:hypothetical protein